MAIVNREIELGMVEEAFTNLVDKESLLRTPIIDFYGIRGIGKTAILEEVKQRCVARNLACIWLDASYPIGNVSHEIVRQIKRYYDQLTYWQNRENEHVNATKALLKERPVVVLLDSVDPTDESRLSWLEMMLRDLIEDPSLFVILASSRGVSFDRARSVSRKLQSYQLAPFDRGSCELYLDSLDNQHLVESAVREIIFEWTHGYPLAINVMAQAILHKGLDPRKEQDQKLLLAILIEQVIHQGIFAAIALNELQWYHTALSLLSIPRRFNLVLLKKLIDEFAPVELRQENVLEYMSLPKRINEATGVLSWNMLRAGFAVDNSVRSLFLLERKIAQPETLSRIHGFLAQANLGFAEGASNTDRVRYLREYLYHLANTQDRPGLGEAIELSVRQLFKEAPDVFVQFSEEFKQDIELQESLGKQDFERVTTLMGEIFLPNDAEG